MSRWASFVVCAALLIGHPVAQAAEADALASDDECAETAKTDCTLNALQLTGAATAKNTADAATKAHTATSLVASEASAIETGLSKKTVRILHLSDTHALHNTIESSFPMPPADILIHTGDFTNFGKDEEFASANEWLGTLKSRYKHIIALLGNHDWIHPETVPKAWNNANYWRSRLPNAQLLLSENITVMGLSIHGESWKHGQKDFDPEGFAGKVPDGVDLLLTHPPAAGIFDWCVTGPWGSSHELFQEVMRAKPRVHLFGHDHEQRGVWQRSQGGSFVGGAEYHNGPGTKAFTTHAPPANYPPQLISNNAMMNMPKYETWHCQGWCASKIVGPARLILATETENGWQFHAEKY